MPFANSATAAIADELFGVMGVAVVTLGATNKTAIPAVAAATRILDCIIAASFVSPAS
jgi:hypothetical protein